MAHGKDTIPICVAAKDFASGGVNFKAQAIARGNTYPTEQKSKSPQ
jgi:hypothetical protein